MVNVCLCVLIFMLSLLFGWLLIEFYNQLPDEIIIKDNPNRSQTKTVDDVDDALRKFDRRLHPGPGQAMDSCIFDRQIWVFDSHGNKELRIYPGTCNA